jgi:hypothetical protein
MPARHSWSDWYRFQGFILKEMEIIQSVLDKIVRWIVQIRSPVVIGVVALPRACRQLSQMIAAARWMAARKFRAVLS